MTTVISAKGKDFVVLGADSQGTIDDKAGARTELKNTIKLKKINNRVGVLYYDEVYVAEYLIDKFKSELKNDDDDVTKIAKDFKKMCINESLEHDSIQITRLPQVGFIMAGLDIKSKIEPKCFGMTSGSGYRLGKYPYGYGIEGKPFVAHYLFRRYYKPSMNKDELCKLVAQSIYDTKKVDGDVGGEIRLAIIDSSGWTDVPTADVYDEYIQKW